MAAYFSTTELQDRLGGGDFTATSIPDTTTAVDMATEISNMWDGLARQTVGAETPDEDVTQACLSAAVYQVGQMRAGEPIDQLVQIKIMKEFMGATGDAGTLFYDNQYPSSTGKW